MPRLPRKLLALVATVYLGLFASLAITDAQTLQIDSSTANWIEGFADFVRWEGDEKSESITIAVIGADEVSNYLNRRAAARSSKPRIKVVSLEPSDSFENVDIVFVGGSNRRHWPEIIQKCKGNKTLSIGAQDGFVKAGGCVEFVVRRNRLRFYIDPSNAETSGVIISSKLLELAIEPKK